MTDRPWFAPDLSLPTLLEMERDRRAAAHMTHHQLAIKADELIQEWYQQREAIQQAAREIAGLQCQLALAQMPCSQAATCSNHN